MTWKICYYGGSELIRRKLRANLSVDKKSQPQDGRRMDCEDYIPFFVVLINRDLLTGNQSRQVLRGYLAHPFSGKLSECLNKSGCRFDEPSHFAKGFQAYP